MIACFFKCACIFCGELAVVIVWIFGTVFSTLNGTSRSHTKENRQLRRQSSSESDDSEKKRLKTVCKLPVANY